jgi:hypothetical protein
VLQRNVSGGPLVLPTLEPPVEVLPGDTIEHEEPLAGFEVVSDQKSTVDKNPVVIPPQKEKAAPSAATDKEASE